MAQDPFGLARAGRHRRDGVARFSAAVDADGRVARRRPLKRPQHGAGRV